MSILQTDGIQFSNGTVVESKYFVMPQYNGGTPHEVFFYQASAPTGWTKSTSQNNKALRVVTGNGRGTGGTSNFTTIFNSTNSVVLLGTFNGSIGNTTLTLQQLPAHSHGAGSAFTARSSAGSSPFRTTNRQPRGYAVRGTRRVQINNRVQVNNRQPRRVRQPRNQRVALRQRREFRVRQPRNFRSRNPLRSRFPFRQPRSYNVRLEARQRRQFSFRRIYARSRLQLRQPRVIRVANPQRRRVEIVPSRFRQRRGARRRRVKVGAFRQRRQRFVDANQRVASSRQRRALRTVSPVRSRFPFRQPRSYNARVALRQRRSFRQRRNVPYRVRYPARSRFPFRQPRSYRVEVNQRVPFTSRQPRTYRTPQRYPFVVNNRITQRTLTPGGTIRGANTQGPATSSSGGGQAHNHTFFGDFFGTSQSLSLRLQYIDIILCRFN